MSRLEKPGWSACDEFKEIIANEKNKQLPQIKTLLTRATKKDINHVKLNLNQQLPVLTSIGIRRHRLPHHEFILLELKERGMMEIAEYIKKLFDISDNLKNEIPLKLQNNLIDRLRNNLTNAEIARKKNDYLNETTILFDTVVFFQSLSDQWIWMVDELFKKTLMSAAMIRHDNGITINIIKFIYGKFLFQRMKNSEEALHYLNEVKNTSKGQNWNGTIFLKTKQNNLYRECNILLYEIYYSMSKKLRNIVPKVAVKISLEALKCANDSNDDEYIAKGLYGLGESQLKAGDISGALKIFSKFLAKVKRIPNYSSICDAHRQLAITYKILGDDDGTRKHFQLYRECSIKFGLFDKLAEAELLTGKYLLEHGLSRESLPHLKIAFEMYKRMEMVEQIDESRYLLGICNGEIVFEEYMKLILNCGNKIESETLKLLLWKNSRIPFWSCIQHNES